MYPYQYAIRFLPVIG
jgi:hypothetical protein